MFFLSLPELALTVDSTVRFCSCHGFRRRSATGLLGGTPSLLETAGMGHTQQPEVNPEVRTSASKAGGSRQGLRAGDSGARGLGAGLGSAGDFLSKVT